MPVIGSRLRAYPRSRCVFLVLCSPIICATLPLLLAAELLVYTCQRGRTYTKTQKEPLLEPSRRADEDEEEEEEEEVEVEKLRRCEEGFGGWFYEGEKEELGLVLLERYLEDQLGLVVGSVVYDFHDVDYGGLDSNHHP